MRYLAILIIFSSCAEHKQRKYNKHILDQYKLDTEAFMNENAVYREVADILNKPSTTKQ